MTGGADWFSPRLVAPGLWALEEGSFVRSWLVVGAVSAALVDSGLGIGDIAAAARRLTDRSLLVLTTHAHWDHVGGHARLPPAWVHPLEAPRLLCPYPSQRLARFLAGQRWPRPFPPGFRPRRYRIRAAGPGPAWQGGDRLDLGGRELLAVDLAGHTPGHLGVLDVASGTLLAGDAVASDWLWAQEAAAALPRWAAALTVAAALPVARVEASHGPSPLPPEALLAAAESLQRVPSLPWRRRSDGLWAVGAEPGVLLAATARPPS